MNLFSPIKSIISRLAPVDNWHFIGSASLTVVFDRMDIHGDWKERVSTTAIATDVVTAEQILGGKLNDTAWIRIISVSGGTFYGLPAKNAQAGQVLSASNGWTIAAGDRIGLAPNTGTFIASIGGSSGGAGGGDASAANQLDQLDALGGKTDSISVSDVLPSGDEGNATVVLERAGGVLYEVTANSGGTGTLEDVAVSGGTYRQCGGWQKDTSGNWRHRPPGTTITLAAGERILAPSDSYGVRFKRTAGTFTLSYRTCDPYKIMARWQQVELPIGTDQNDSSLVAASALPSIPTGATVAYVTIEPAVAGTESAIRFTQDGTTTPTSSAGTWKRASGEPFPIYGATNMSNWNAIDALNTSKLSVTYKEEVYKG